MVKKQKYLIPLITGVALIAVAVILGGQYNIFDSGYQIDKIFHFAGGFIAAWLTVVYLGNGLNSFTSVKRVLILMAGACLIGTLWEFVEYLSTVYTQFDYPTIYHYYHGGDLADTIGDLAADIIGAGVYAVMAGRSK